MEEEEEEEEEEGEAQKDTAVDDRNGKGEIGQTLELFPRQH